MTRAYTASRQRLAQLRLAAQGLGTTPLGTPTEVARHLLAIQAQSFERATWALGLRAGPASREQVGAAIAAREIVRSWPTRGTLHLTPAEDLGWMLALTGERTVARAAGRHRQLGLDEPALTRAAQIAAAAVGEAGLLSRADLLTALDAGGVSTAGQRGAHLLLYLSVTGLLVFGPHEGTQPTFALLDEWVRAPRAIAGDEALAEFARRYFVSHGPASDRDFAWWSSLTLTQARRGLSIVAGELERIDIDGVQYWHRAGLEPAPAGVVALPGFDEYLLGYQNREAQLSAEWFERVVPGGNGMFLAMIVVNGEIVGTWKRASTAKKVTVTPELFASLSVANERALQEAFSGYARFLGLPLG
jgi:hypothetical protein